jgi:transcriptional regulator with XRE-family HTH domain
MAKTIFTQEYVLFLRHLRESRKKARLTQEQLAEKLNQTQSFISKCERGERRIDVVELRGFCLALGIPVEEFIRELEKIISEEVNNNYES